jgi:hypothetical protein
MDAEAVLAELDRIGLLLLHDKHLPSVSLLVAGEPVPGSWWSHPRGGTIFRVSEALDDRDDVVSVKLVSRKLTFVHRRLWPALLGIGQSGEPWQKKGLTAAARSLLRRLDKEGSLRSDTLPSPDVARALEQRVLVFSRQIHTEGGHHAKVLESWKSFAERTSTKALPAKRARAALEQAAQELGAGARLPWAVA